VLDHLLVGYL